MATCRRRRGPRGASLALGTIAGFLLASSPARFVDRPVHAQQGPVQFEVVGEIVASSTQDQAFVQPMFEVLLPAGALPDGTRLPVRRLLRSDATLRGGPNREVFPISPVYDIGPADRSIALDRPATVAFNYFELGIEPTRLQDAIAIMFFDRDQGQWVPLPSEVDPDAAAIQAEIDHFTLLMVALMGAATLYTAYSLASILLDDWDYLMSHACVYSQVRGGYLSAARFDLAPHSRFAVCWREDPANAPVPPDRTRVTIRTGSGRSSSPPYSALIPTYVVEILDALWEARSKFESIGIRTPVWRTYVLVQDHRNDAGEQFAKWERAKPGTPRFWVPFYIFVGNNIRSDPSEGPFDRVRAAVVHEYFHACQDLYHTLHDREWWHEASATAVEEEVLTGNLGWLFDYYDDAARNGLFELGEALETPAPHHGYQVSIWAKYLMRKHGLHTGLRRIWEEYDDPGVDFTEAFSRVLGSGARVSTEWRRFGEKLVFDPGDFLTAPEIALLYRGALQGQAIQFRHNLPAAVSGRGEPALAVHARREDVPLSTWLYRLYLTRLPAAPLPPGPTSGPLLVRFIPGSENEDLHAATDIVPRMSRPNGQPQGNDDPANFQLERRLDASVGHRTKFFEIGRLARNSAPAASGVPALREHAYLWLVDGDLRANGRPSNVYLTWLMPPTRPELAWAGAPPPGKPWRLSWDMSSIQTANLRDPNFLFDGYAVYHRPRPAAPLLPAIPGPLPADASLVAVTDRTGVDLPMEELVTYETCHSFGIGTQLRQSQVEGTHRSDLTWIHPAVDVDGFALNFVKPALQPDGSYKAVRMKDGSFEIEATAVENRIGVHEVELLVEIGGTEFAKTNTILNFVNRTPGKPVGAHVVWRPGVEWIGKEGLIIARAWVLPPRNPCFDPGAHILETKIPIKVDPPGKVTIK